MKVKNKLPNGYDKIVETYGEERAERLLKAIKKFIKKVPIKEIDNKALKDWD